MSIPPLPLQAEASFPLYQIWWGEFDLGVTPLETKLTLHRDLESIDKFLHIDFQARDQGGDLVHFSMLANYFTKVEHTDRKSFIDFPTSLIFHLHDVAFDELVKRLPGKVAEYGPKLREKKRALAHSLLFIVDPSVFTMAENNVVLYSPGFLEGIGMFKQKYNDQWEDHTAIQDLMYGKHYIDPIVSLDSAAFQEYFKSHGLRNYESKHRAGPKNKAVKLFMPRRNVKRRKARRYGKKKPKAKKTEEGEGGEENEEDEEDDEDHEDEKNGEQAWEEEEEDGEPKEADFKMETNQEEGDDEELPEEAKYDSDASEELGTVSSAKPAIQKKARAH